MNDTGIKSSYLLALFATFNYLQSFHVSAIFPIPFEVFVVSQLPANSSLLHIHCASKDNDLGDHDLHRDGQFRWQFRMNFWGTTEFWCHFWWNSKDRRFTVMRWSFAKIHCGHDLLIRNTCFWMVREDGFYFSNRGISYEITEKLRDWPQ